MHDTALMRQLRITAVATRSLGRRAAVWSAERVHGLDCRVGVGGAYRDPLGRRPSEAVADHDAQVEVPQHGATLGEIQAVPLGGQGFR